MKFIELHTNGLKFVQNLQGKNRKTVMLTNSQNLCIFVA